MSLSKLASKPLVFFSAKATARAIADLDISAMGECFIVGSGAPYNKLENLGDRITTTTGKVENTRTMLPNSNLAMFKNAFGVNFFHLKNLLKADTVNPFNNVHGALVELGMVEEAQAVIEIKSVMLRIYYRHLEKDSKQMTVAKYNRLTSEATGLDLKDGDKVRILLSIINRFKPEVTEIPAVFKTGDLSRSLTHFANIVAGLFGNTAPAADLANVLTWVKGSDKNLIQVLQAFKRGEISDDELARMNFVRFIVDCEADDLCVIKLYLDLFRNNPVERTVDIHLRIPDQPQDSSDANIEEYVKGCLNRFAVSHGDDWYTFDVGTVHVRVCVRVDPEQTNHMPVRTALNLNHFAPLGQTGIAPLESWLGINLDEEIFNEDDLVVEDEEVDIITVDDTDSKKRPAPAAAPGSQSPEKKQRTDAEEAAFEQYCEDNLYGKETQAASSKWK